MDIDNIRHGFATNSSSSHSLVFFDGAGEIQEFNKNLMAHDEEYGWDDFELTSLEEKLNYALVQAVGSGWATDDIDSLFEQYSHLFPEYSQEDFVRASTGYVDHQSKTNNIVSLVSAARDPKVHITGGNDNTMSTSEKYILQDEWETEDGQPVYTEGVSHIEDIG